MSHYSSTPDPPVPGRPTVVAGFARPVNPVRDAMTPWRRGSPELVAPDGYPRLEVFDDRIRLHETATAGREWLKTDGDRVLYDSHGRHPGFYVGRAAGTGIDATSFDVGAIRSAVLLHGWSWEADGAVTEPTRPVSAASSVSAKPQVDLVLKPHKEVLDTARLMRLGSRVWASLGAVVFALGLAAVVIWLGATAFYITMGVVVVVPLIVLCVQAVRHAGLAVTITHDRLVVRTGSDTQTVERRRLVGSAVVDRFGITFTFGTGFRDVLYVPTRRRREELLAQLSAFGWPLEHKRK